MSSLKWVGHFSNAGKCLQIVELGVGAQVTLQKLDMGL
jgi:hypothetical protein